MSSEEERQLETLNQGHRATSAIRQLLEGKIDFEDPDQGSSQLPVQNATMILQACGRQNPSNTEAKECAAVLRERLGAPSKSNGILGWRIKFPDIEDLEGSRF